MRIAATFAVVAMLASGSASAQNGDILKGFHFDINGVLPSEDPQIELFNNGPKLETEVYSVAGGLLEQRTLLGGAGNYSYSFPDSTLTGGGLDSTKSLCYGGATAHPRN